MSKVISESREEGVLWGIDGIIELWSGETAAVSKSSYANQD